MRTIKKTVCLGWFAALLVWLPANLFAQSYTLTGKVLESNGSPLPGATIVETANNRNGTVAGRDGTFSLTLPASAVSVTVSYLGFETELVPLNGRTEINITLKDDTGISMDDIVVIGYGTARRGDLTSAISSVDEKTLSAIPVTSVLEAIVGRMPGVHVASTEGGPHATRKVRVRGGGSITQNSEPLYVVDGFPVDNIEDIPPGDIERVDVLKDAASTAIYGAKGANGVVLVTTKTGKAGRTNINVNSYVGISKIYGLTPVLSPYEYVYFQRELDPSTGSNTSFYNMYGQWDDLDIYKRETGTDWQDKLFGNTGIQQSYNVSINGGNDNYRFAVSYTHDDQKYIMLNSNYKRDNIQVRLNKNLFPNLDLDFSARMSNGITEGPHISDGRKLRDAIKYAPVKSLSSLSLEGTADATIAEAQSALNNPVDNIQNEYRKDQDFNNSYDIGLTWRIVPGLSYRGQARYGYRYRHNDNIHTAGTGKSASNGGLPVAERNIYKGNSWSIQNSLTYSQVFNEIHSLNIMAGQEIHSSQTDRTQIQSKLYPIEFTAQDVLAMWNYGEPAPTYTTIGEPNRTASFFGRVGYTLNNRYLFNFVARTDGTNVFAPGNRWGFFPGASAAWRFSEEPFMDATRGWLADGKLRVSYGLAGNARVSSFWRQDYTFTSAPNQLYYPNESPASALKPGNTLKNEELTWEKKLSRGVGLDLGFLNNRLQVTIDAYKDTTKDLILRVNIPRNSGYQYQYRNLGQTTNKGLEFSATGEIIKRHDLIITAGFNISFNRGVIDKLDESDMLSASSGWGLGLGSDDYRAAVGKPIGQMWGYRADGYYSFDDFTFNPELARWVINDGVPDASTVISGSQQYFGPGHMKLKKLSGEGMVVNPDDDRTVIGSAQPKHTGGFHVSAQWKGFDLAAYFNWSYGNDIYNANKIDNTSFAGAKRYNNVSTEMSLENRFTTIDPETGRNIMYGSDANPELFRQLNQDKKIWHPMFGLTLLTDWAVEDGSFLRLGTLTLGYTLPQHITQRFGIQRLRVYATGYNVFTLTNYSGQDPEVDTRTATPLTPGVDYSAYPKTHNYVFGINLTF